MHIENTFCYKVDRNTPAANAGNLECVVSPSCGNPSCLQPFHRTWLWHSKVHSTN